MKRLILAAIAALGLFALAQPAQAVVTETSVSNGGVTCWVRSGGTYPEDGHFYYCNGQNNPTKTAVLNSLKNVLGAYANVRNALSAQGHKFYFFDTVEAAALFQHDPGLPPLTTTDLQAVYNDSVNSGNEAGRTYQPVAGGPRQSQMYERVTTGTYPNYAVKPLDGVLQRNALHEMGHAYDFYRLGGPFSSEQELYLRAVRIDQTQMELQAESPTAQSLQSTYSYYLLKPTTGVSAGTWHELYAEEFAAYAISDRGSSVGTQHAVYAAALSPYHKCSMLHVQKNITDNADPTAGQLQLAGCDGTIFCNQYASPSPSYPGNGINAYVCGPRVQDPITHVWSTALPPTTRTQQLYDSGLNSKLAANTTVRTQLQNRRVMFFFFRNQAEANSFAQKQRPLKMNNGYQHLPPVPITAADAERCGHTFYHADGVVVAAAIYDECALSTGGITNPDLLRTGINETGMAFALSYEKQAAGSNPAAKAGFELMRTTDVTNLTPAGTNWTGAPAMNKDKYICGMFGTTANSQLEQDMGSAKDTSPSSPTYKGPVCTGTTVNAPWKSGTTYATPSEIASTDNKVPSTVLNTRAELWAEEFTVLVLDKNSPSNLQPITDMVLGFDNPASTGITNRRAMNCTRFVVETYRSSGQKPTNAQLSNIGCPTHADYN